ncbi:MAG TPA: DUF4292 domain-containing protein [Bacteroidia bacterium]|nr:DUF4292 domain-containing protein [Bacteroidia bacterium]
MLVVLSSCKHPKHLRKTEHAEKTEIDSLAGKCKLDYKNAKALSRLMGDSELKFDWIFAKANVESKIDDKEESFDIRISARNDSAMLVNIQYVLGINVAKVLITLDSVKFVDYIHKTYFKGDFQYINDMLNTELDFDLLQSVLFGNSAEFYDDDKRLKPVTNRENCYYMLSSERKKRLKRIQMGVDSLAEDLQTLSLDPETFKIFRNEFVQSSTGRKFIAGYSDFGSRDSVYAPYRVDIDILAQKEAHLKIKYVRIEKNTPQKLGLNIPAKYDAIQIRKK